MAAAPPKTLSISPPESRTALRRELRLRVQGRLPSGDEEVLLINISQAGVLVQSVAPLAEGETFTITLPGSEPVAATVVWARQGYAGCRFTRQLSPEEINRALLRSDIAHPDEMELLRERVEAARYDEAGKYDEAGDLGPPASVIPSGQRVQLIPGLAVASWVLLIAVGTLVYLLLA